MSGDEELVQSIKLDPRGAAVSPARRAMLDYVIVLTETPWAVTEEHVGAMRENGHSDQAIAVTNLVACFFAWCNRIVDGLGIPMEDFWPEEIRARENEVKQTPR